MRDDDHRHAELGIHALQQVEHLHGRARVERARRLVAQHVMRAVRQRAGDGHALLLAARKLARIARALSSRLTRRSSSWARSALASFGHAAHLEGEHDVLQHRALLEQAEVLEDHADVRTQLAQLLALEVGDVDAVDDDTALGRALEQVEQAHERRLARARFADDAEDVAILDGQVDVLERAVVAVAGVVHLAHVDQFYHRLTPPPSTIFRPRVPIPSDPRATRGADESAPHSLSHFVSGSLL